MNNRKKISYATTLIVTALLIVGGLVFLTNKPAGEGKIVGGGKIRSVAYNDATHPAPGTQLFNMEIKDNKLVQGPDKINSVLGGAFKIDITVHTTAAEYEFYVDHYIDDGTAEIDYSPDDQKNVLTGQIYVLTDTRGTFHYGVEDEATGIKYQLGILNVE